MCVSGFDVAYTVYPIGDLLLYRPIVCLGEMKIGSCYVYTMKLLVEPTH